MTRLPAAAWASHGWGGFLGVVEASEPLAARGQAIRARRKGRQVPEVGEDTSALQAQAVVKRLLKQREGRRCELPLFGQSVQSAVAGPGRNERRHAGAAIEGKIDRPLRPAQPFLVEEWQTSRMNARRAM